MRHKQGLDVTFGTYGQVDYSDHSRVYTKDPVCGCKLDEAKAPHKAGYAGQMYYFCSQDCQTKFQDHPGKYIRKAG